MIIELSGVSGVGKSTVMRALIGVMRQNGLSGMSLDRIARRSTMSEEEAYEQSAARNQALFELIASGPADQIATLRALAASWERAISADAGMIAVVDEGFAHRLAYICTNMQPALFEAAFALAPRPDHLFLLHTPAAVAASRSIERRLPAAQAAATAERQATSQQHEAVAVMLETAVATLSRGGGRAWTIDATQRPRRTARAILSRLAETE